MKYIKTPMPVSQNDLAYRVELVKIQNFDMGHEGGFTTRSPRIPRKPDFFSITGIGKIFPLQFFCTSKVWS
jgi:hypothetical protein